MIRRIIRLWHDHINRAADPINCAAHKTVRERKYINSAMVRQRGEHV
ncbi:hypothetical protein CSB69_1131 [Morganella morganii]|nr:hypothetical protein CSB69_1131 [Morganella morganii]EMP51699.1 hypothetical protein C790_00886 [Morganella morganii SC01]